MKLTNHSGETARDVAKRFAQLACVKLLEAEAGSEDEMAYEKEDLNSHTESKDPIHLSSQQKKEAKSRAKKRLEDMEKQIAIARSNYIQLGGRLEDTLSNEFKKEQNQLKYCYFCLDLLFFLDRFQLKGCKTNLCLFLKIFIENKQGIFIKTNNNKFNKTTIKLNLIKL